MDQSALAKYDQYFKNRNFEKAKSDDIRHKLQSKSSICGERGSPNIVNIY